MFNVAGWFVDTNAQGWGRRRCRAGLSRPDGNPYPYWSACGFLVQVPASSLPVGNQLLGVYLRTHGNSCWYESDTVDVGAAIVFAAPPVIHTPHGLLQVTITSPIEDQTISTTKGDFTITGTALEPGIGPLILAGSRFGWMESEVTARRSAREYLRIMAVGR